MRTFAILVLVACGPRPAPRAEAPTTPDAGAVPVAVPVDAAAPDATLETRECFCFSWVHRDENGETCLDTAAKCDAAFQAFGRTDKLPCRAAPRAECTSYACRGGGAECFRL